MVKLYNKTWSKKIVIVDIKFETNVYDHNFD